MNNKNKMKDSTQSFQKQKVMTSTENKVENSFIKFCESNFENSLQNKTGLLVIDGIVNPKRAYKSLSEKQINSAFILCKIQKVIERLFINQFGVPVIIQRIIGGDVFRFAKIVGITPITPEQSSEIEYILACCTFAYIGETVIYEHKK
ncbi:MAG: hypothetical protein E7059_01210 [Treponema bryantii]|nr:hypothetical protein [Treponema bryantii]